PGSGTAPTVTPGASAGLSVASLAPGYTLTLVNKPLTTATGSHGASHIHARYGATSHDIQATPGSQILPRVFQNVHVTGSVARGVVLDHATFTNHSGFFALTDNATIDTSGSRCDVNAPRGR